MRKYSLEEVIAKAQKNHNNKYDYSLIEIYTGMNDKYEIICKKCNNIFEQTFGSHMKHGCPFCKLSSQKYSLKAMINRSREIHGDKYNYGSIKEYKGVDIKHDIICNTCNKTFSQSFSSHIYKKHGCYFCANNKYNLEIAIKKAKEVHGDKYSYVLIREYTKMNDKYEIICNKCDEIFTQCFGDHVWSKQGCPFCASKRNNLESVIEKAKLIHGDKYSYELIKKYTRMRDKYEIICNKCKQTFTQCMSKHINSKQGCPFCANKGYIVKTIKGNLTITHNIKYTLETMIKDAKAIHGDKYSYELIKEYTRKNNKYDIICNTCGRIFKTSISTHINKATGCPFCANVKNDLELAIQKAKKIHGNYYSYDLIEEYKGMNHRYEIVCNKCNKIFEMTFTSHTTKQLGCNFCYQEYFKKNGPTNKRKLQDIIEQAIDKFGDIFDYSLITADIYINMDKKYDIICKTCNKTFKRNFHHHLSHNALCPYCRIYKYSKIAIKAFSIIEKVKNVKIKHAESGGETRIDLQNYKGKLEYYKSHFMIDGITENGTLIEFNGCEYHGCPDCTSHSAISAATGKPYKELYKKTLEKKRILLDLGYSYTEIWECKFREALGDNEDPDTNPDLKNFILGLKKLTKKKKVEEVIPA